MTVEAAAPLSFNAVKLTPAQVARGFVPPPAFGRLVRADNALLIGPRGSGKTTLLKMLQAEALEEWSEELAENFLAEMDSVGVFVGTDRMWSEQIRSSEGVTTALGVAAYGHHIALQLAATILYRIENPGSRLGVALSHEGEQRVSREFCDGFDLDADAGTIRGVARAIKSRLVQVGKIRSRARQTLGPLQLPNWIHFDPLTAAAFVTEVFNEEAREPGRKWSFLFDELELAPKAVLVDLLAHLRGSPQHLNLKLSLAPMSEQIDALRGIDGAVAGQDVEYISLTDLSRRESENFTQRLLEAALKQRVRGWSAPVQRMLGTGLMATERETASSSPSRTSRAASAYFNGGSVQQAMVRLRRVDPTFASYLDKNDVDLEALGQMKDSERAARIRKVRNLVVAREYYIANGRRRSRKSFALYAGTDAMLALPDGNPRMAISLIRELIAGLESNTKLPLREQEQSAALGAVLERFVALMNAQQGVSIDGRNVTVMEFLDLLGNHLANRLFRDPFKADAPAEFRVDPRLDSQWFPLIERAINAGGLILSDSDDGQALFDDPRGKEFRLSYLLAPRWGLPLRRGHAVPLSVVVTASGRRPFMKTDSLQPGLFDLDGE